MFNIFNFDRLRFHFLILCLTFSSLKWGCLQAQSDPTTSQQPTLFRFIPANENSWPIIRSEILDEYFYKNYIEENPQSRPFSVDNPLGYAAKGSPWTPERDRTAKPVSGLDILGPDGLIYPNFAFAGVQGGIPANLPIRATIAKDTGDFASQLEEAIHQVESDGGGVIQIESGRFSLRRPIEITSDRIVIRGRGANEKGTIIQNDYGFGAKEILWLGLRPDSQKMHTLGLYSEVAIQAALQQGGGGTATPPPYGTLTLAIDGKTIARADGETLKTDWFVVATGIFTCKISGRDLIKQGIAPGKHTAVATATWSDGTTKKTSCDFVFDPAETTRQPLPRGMIDFRGFGLDGTAPLIPPLPRGTTLLPKPVGLKLAVGVFVRINVTCSKGWLVRHKMTNNQNFSERQGIFQVAAIQNDGGIVLNQPLRFTVEADESVKLEKIKMLQYCGIEDLSMETPAPNALHSVYLRYAANCWAKNLRLLKPGVGGLWGRENKWIEVRQLEVEDGWFKGGGMAYIGWEASFDCLLDGAKGRGLRHAPNMQYSSSGCVIRNGEFEDSDGQFHSGWPHENLIENCTVRSRRGNGSYGFGFIFAVNRQPGPRNVLYNNDFAAENYPALFIGGPCEGSMFLYNRFFTKKGPSIYMQYGSFNQTFLGNYLVTENAAPGFVFIASPDCTGNEFINNTFSCGRANDDPRKLNFFAGALLPETIKDNSWTADKLSGRPKPKVASLYEWQVNALRKPNGETPSR